MNPTTQKERLGKLQRKSAQIVFRITVENPMQIPIPLSTTLTL